LPSLLRYISLCQRRVTPRVYAVGGGAVSLGTKRVPRSPSRRPLPSTLLYLPVSLWLSSVVRRPLLRVRIFSSAVLLSFRRISLFPLVFSLFPLHFLLPLIFLSFGYISLFPLQFSPSALSLPFSVTFFFFFFSIRPSLPPLYVSRLLPFSLCLSQVFRHVSFLPWYPFASLSFRYTFSFRSLNLRPRCHPSK
jgi:hypothetical protein